MTKDDPDVTLTNSEKSHNESKTRDNVKTTVNIESHVSTDSCETLLYERERSSSYKLLEPYKDRPANPIQYGTGTDNNVIPYTFQQTNQKTFAKNLAIETTYRLKFRTGWKNHKMKDLMKEIHNMFKDIIERVKGDGGDLGRIIVNHPEFHHALAIPLDKWSNINAQKVMEAIESFLNSDESLPIDEQMTVVVGNISIPKGSGKRVHITRLYGDNSSIAIKRSLYKVENSEDNLCLPTAIGRTFVKLCPIVTLDKWRSITENDHPSMNATMKVIKHRVMTGSYLRNK